MNILITICARGNNKGLPNKHLLNFCRKPLIEWTLKQAAIFYIENENEIDIICSSDSEQILKLANKYLISSCFRKERLSRDDTAKLDVLRDVLKSQEIAYKKKYDILIDLDATNPCRKIEDIENCLSIFLEKRPKTLISVTKARKNPYFNQLIKNDRKWKVETPRTGVYTRRQDVPGVYDVNSCIYIYSTDWLQNISVDEGWDLPWWSDTELYLMPDYAFCDIDTELDFKISEFLFKEYYQ